MSPLILACGDISSYSPLFLDLFVEILSHELIFLSRSTMVFSTMNEDNNCRVKLEKVHVMAIVRSHLELNNKKQVVQMKVIAKTFSKRNLFRI